MIGMSFFQVSLCFIHEFVIVLAGNLLATWTAEMSHKFPFT